MVTLSEPSEQLEFARRITRGKRPKRNPHGGSRASRKKQLHRLSKSGIIRVSKPITDKTQTMQRQYTIYSGKGKHLSYADRKILERDWNSSVQGCTERLSIHEFARRHRMSYTTWRRELKRGALQILVKNVKRAGKHRWIYPEYSADKAQQNIADGNANKGIRSRITKPMEERFCVLVLEMRKSPYDAMMCLREEMPDKAIPCLKSWYNLIYSGQSKVKYGMTPYHPGKRNKHPFAHPARTIPGHRTLKYRPKEADERSQLGHYEMDTVLSGRGSRGGLLVAIDRMSRRYVVERMPDMTQESTLKALKRMVKRGALDNIKSITTDNGMEFYNASKIEALLKIKVYYTRAYAAWEKGSIENCNRLVRRWFPKSTNFRKVSRSDIRRLEYAINTIHRKALNGATAYAYETLAA